MRFSVLLLPLLIAGPALAVPPLPAPEDIVAEHARQVDSARMKRTVEKLVSFGTRHTLSSQTDKRRGIGAALKWTERQFKRTGLETFQVCDGATGRRIPVTTRVCDVVAIQHGTERPNDVVIITGHIDSRVSNPMDFTRDAPGANDDGSGTAAVLEAAQVLAKRKFPGTIVYAVLSGEEQGLYGGKILAEYATTQKWNVVANLNNDIIGNICGSDGVCDAKTVRVFSEGPRWQGHEELAAQQRSLGGENDSPSRNLSRFLDTLAERLPSIGLDVRQIWRNDRHGRGGDHTEFLNAGFPAVRFSVAVENYNYQHQDLRTEKGVEYGDTIDKMDFPYLAKVTKLNVAALAWLASAPPPPEPAVEGAVSTDTTITILPKGGYTFRIYCRRTDASMWGQCVERDRLDYTGRVRPLDSVLPHIRVDDWIFGVSAIGQNGFESPVASAVPGGAFKPYVAPPESSPRP